MAHGLKETVERELKLSADPGFRLPELDGEPLEPRTFTSTYFDTADYRLAGAGVTLRRRVENARGLWQLKLPRGVARLELESPGGPAGPPKPMRELVTAYLRGAELVPVAKLRTQRAGVRVHENGRSVADVTVDSVALMVKGRVTRAFRELEAELLDGSEEALRRLERALRAAGAFDGDGRPKVFQALGLPALGLPAPPARSAPAAEHLRAALAAQYGAILHHDPGTRLGRDPEELHQMRVATRRMRAFLRTARPLLDPGWAEPLRAELRWLGSALGVIRDLDVLIEQLLDDASSLEPREQRALRRLFALLDAQRASAREALLEALESERYLALLDRLEEAARSPELVISPEVSLRDLAATEFRRLRKAVKALGPEPSDAELHAIRIRGKRSRYAAELAEGIAGKRASRFIQEAKQFQDVLGAHQDAVLAEERVRALIRQAGGPAAAFAAGRLVERARRRRLGTRAAFPAAWERLEKTGRKAWK